MLVRTSLMFCVFCIFASFVHTSTIDYSSTTDETTTDSSLLSTVDESSSTTEDETSLETTDTTADISIPKWLKKMKKKLPKPPKCGSVSPKAAPGAQFFPWMASLVYKKREFFY